MKFFVLSFLILGFGFVAFGAPVEQPPALKKKSSMGELAPPLDLDPSCYVISCYRNMLNMSNSCKKGEFLHSFKKCEKKFFREDTCCKNLKV